jgi:crossover junction endodeoxyribonuclease RusA
VSQPLSFRVRGVAVPKARARVVTNDNGTTRAFTPPTTVAWERAIEKAFTDAYPHHRPFPKGVEVGVSIEIIAPGDGPTASIKGDLDNQIKALLDGLNKVAYTDDIQVVVIHAMKRRVRRGELPGAEVKIWQV